MNKPASTITGHTGNDGTADNSLDSVKLSIEMGADIAELDVRFDKQGGLVISHDRKDDYSGYPSLREAMELVIEVPAPRWTPAFVIHCDVKEAETVPAVLALAQEMGIGPDKLAFSGRISPALLRKNPEITKRADVYLGLEEILLELYIEKLSSSELDAIKGMSSLKVVRERMGDISGYADMVASIVRELNVKALNLSLDMTHAPIFPALQKHDLPFSVWTVNDASEIKRLLDLKVCNITTRNLKTALPLREAMYGKLAISGL